MRRRCDLDLSGQHGGLVVGETVTGPGPVIRSQGGKKRSNNVFPVSILEEDVEPLARPLMLGHCG